MYQRSPCAIFCRYLRLFECAWYESSSFIYPCKFYVVTKLPIMLLLSNRWGNWGIQREAKERLTSTQLATKCWSLDSRPENWAPEPHWEALQYSSQAPPDVNIRKLSYCATSSLHLTQVYLYTCIPSFPNLAFFFFFKLLYFGARDWFQVPSNACQDYSRKHHHHYCWSCFFLCRAMAILGTQYVDKANPWSQRNPPASASRELGLTSALGSLT